MNYLKTQNRKCIFTANSPNWLFSQGLHQKGRKWETGDESFFFLKFNFLFKGEFDWIVRDDGVGAVTWNDSAMVNFLSFGFPPSASFQHSKRKRGERNGIACTIPLVASHYRQNYHAMDIFDKNVHSWRLANRARKWTHAAFWSFLKFALVNSWVLFKLHKKSKISQLDFIRSVYLEME